MSTPEIHPPKNHQLILSGATCRGTSEDVFSEGSDVLATLRSESLARVVGDVINILRNSRSTENERDLAMAKAVGGRDYKTNSAGGYARNVVPVAALRDENGVSMEKLAELIKGRDYLVLAHGEGEEARTTVIINDSVNKNVPTAFAIVREGKAEVLLEGMLHDLCEHSQDRVLLGPLNHQSCFKQTGTRLYHESQRGDECAMHALNAVHGGPLLNKAVVDQFFIHRALGVHRGAVSEDDFYLNAPLVSEDPLKRALINLDHGMDSDQIKLLAEELLEKGGAASPPFATRISSQYIDTHQEANAIAKIAEVEAQESSKAFVLYCPGTQGETPGADEQPRVSGHYVAFVKTSREGDGDSGWRLIDSTRSDQPEITPSQYLQETPANYWLMCWHA